MIFKIITCFKLWDIIYGEAWNVLTHVEILVRLAEDGRIDPWLALHCQSFTFARDPALRDVTEPLGKSGLFAWQQELVEI